MLLAGCAKAPCEVPLVRTQLGSEFPINPYGGSLLPPQCALERHDVIIVLGCPSQVDGSASTCQKRRTEMALALRDAGYADRFITTGGAVHTPQVEADALAALLTEAGVADSDILREPQAQHTDENLHFSTLLMQERGLSSALVVSEDAGHLIYAALCDANCCVRRGRLTVFDYPVASGSIRAGHYVLEPTPSDGMKRDCAYLEDPSSLLCLNLPNRHYCR